MASGTAPGAMGRPIFDELRLGRIEGHFKRLHIADKHQLGPRKVAFHAAVGSLAPDEGGGTVAVAQDVFHAYRAGQGVPGMSARCELVAKDSSTSSSEGCGLSFR